MSCMALQKGMKPHHVIPMTETASSFMLCTGEGISPPIINREYLRSTPHGTSYTG